MPRIYVKIHDGASNQGLERFLCPRGNVFSYASYSAHLVCMHSPTTWRQVGKCEVRMDVGCIWKEVIEEGRWRRKQVKDCELGVAESNLEKVLTSCTLYCRLYVCGN